MDKPQDLRRGASRFPAARRHIKQSGQKPFGGLNASCGDSEFPEKSKKEKVRSLSAVSRALSSYEDGEMGCDISEKVDAIAAQPPSSSIIANRRFKIPKKFFGDCNGVDHACVPRKLRSAMKKRNRESVLIDSEKVSHKTYGIESPEEDGIKKTKKQGSSEWSLRQTATGSITKDEEEVVETLYALAGMFPDSGSNERSELHGESLPENSSTLQDSGESPNSAFEASGTGQDVSVSCAEEKASKVGSFKETIQQKQPDLPESSNFSLASDSTALMMGLQNMPLARNEKRSNISTHDPGLCLAIGLDRPQQSPAPYVERRPEIALEMKNAFECKQEQHMIKDQTKNEGLALWPGLSLVASDRNRDPYLQSSAAKAPVWLDAAISAASKQCLMEGCSSGGKLSKVVDKRSWKRCAAHVHISRMIQRLQIPNSKDMFLEQPNQMRAREGPKHGVLAEVHELNGIKNKPCSAPQTCQSATDNKSHEAKNDILQQQHLYTGMSQAAPSTGVYDPQKQNFDLLSLSAGDNGLKVNNNYNKVGNRLEPLSKLQVPYLQSLAQQHGLMPFPMPQSQYASTFRDQICVPGPQVRLQLPPYYGNPAASNKLQHQNFWAVQLAAQGRSAVNCSIQYPNWQAGRQDAAAFLSHAQPIIPLPPASLGPKITPVSQQQQNIIARTRGLDFHMPSICEENRDRFSNNGTTSLQLLCHERIGL